MCSRKRNCTASDHIPWLAHFPSMLPKPRYHTSLSLMYKNGLLFFAATCMDLKSIMLSKISQMEKDKYHIDSLICEL